MKNFRYASAVATCGISALAVIEIYAGCSSSSDSGSGPGAPDSGKDGSYIIYPDASGDCDPTKPFGPPVFIPSLDPSATDVSATLSPDELTIYFSHLLPEGDYRIAWAKRDQITDGFGPLTYLPGLQAGVDASVWDFDPWIAADNLSLYFASQGGRLGSLGGTDLFLAKRADTTADFANPVAVPNVNSANNDRCGSLPGDQKTLYLLSDRDSTHGHRIYRATSSNGTFTAGQLFDSGDETGEFDDFPVPSSDNLTLFFASTRTGSQGGRDIWVATRSNPSDDFGAPTNMGDVAKINGPADEIPDWLSPDGCRLYLHSGRTEGGATHAIWVATRPH